MAFGAKDRQQPLVVVDDNTRPPIRRQDSSDDVVKTNLATEYQKELFRLTMLESDQEERLELVRKRCDSLEAEHADTKSRKERVQADIKSLEDTLEVSIRIKRRQRDDAKCALSELQVEMERVQQAYESQLGKLRSRVHDWEEEVVGLELDIAMLERRQWAAQHEDTFQGIRALWWLDNDIFHIFTVLVTILNVLIILLEGMHPNVDYACLDNFFLVFYLAELVLNLLHKRHQFLLGDFQTVWWNWLDLMIVVVGTGEFLLGLVARGSRDALLVNGPLRILRLLRLLRVLKVVHIIFQSNMSWAEGQSFQTFMLCVIAFNTLMMSCEVQCPDCSFLPIVNYILLFIYVFEILVRLKHHGGAFFCGSAWGELIWNWLDLCIVAGGVCDACLAMNYPLTGGNNDDMSQVMSILRMARLMRVVRLVKLLRQVPQLYTLVVGIAKAMQGMGWVMLLVVSVLWICSLVGVKLVGQGRVFDEDLDEDVRAKAQESFHDIPIAFFNLFKAMNADLGAFGTLMDVVAPTKYILMLFVVVTNWAIFSILTAVVSENMVAVTSAHEGELREAKEAEAREQRAVRLELLFNRLDSDGDGTLDLNEFQALLADDVQAEELSRVSSMSVVDLEDLFDLLSKKPADSKGVKSITHRQFTELLNKESRQVTMRSMMKIERALEAIQQRLQIEIES